MDETVGQEKKIEIHFTDVYKRSARCVLLLLLYCTTRHAYKITSRRRDTLLESIGAAEAGEIITSIKKKKKNEKRHLYTIWR